MSTTIASGGAAPNMAERIPSADKVPKPATTKINVALLERQISVGGGALLAVLGLARRDIPGLLAAGVGAGLVYRGASGHCPLYQSLGVDSAVRQDSKESRSLVSVVETFLINQAPEHLYRFWRALDELPAVMSHLKEVRVLDERRSHWVAHAPAIAGGQVEWDAEIIDDQPNARIAWQSLPGAGVVNAGSVEFSSASGSRGTIVRARLKYEPPAGQIGHWLTKLFGDDPEHMIREDLRNFKRLMEVGEILTTKGQPRGACFAGIGRLMH